MIGWYVQRPEFPPLGIVFGSLLRVAQNLVRSLDLLKLGDPFVLLARVSIRMVLECEFPEGLANVVVAGGGGDAQVGVVVAARVDFGHGDVGCQEEGVKGGRRLTSRVWFVSAAGRSGLCLYTHCFV